MQERQKRQNHKAARVSELLAVPRYADIVEDEAADLDGDDDEHPGSSRPSGLIKSREKWRQELAKWIHDERAQESDTDDEQEERTGTFDIPQNQPRRGGAKWLPRSLDLLFGGRKEADIDVQMRRIRRQTAYTEEARLMELLAAEEADGERVPDDGELEGSGDDFYA